MKRFMSKQEIFDKAAAFIIKQGKPSYQDDVGCCMLSSDGSMCAVGCLMPDEWTQCVRETKFAGIWFKINIPEVRTRLRRNRIRPEAYILRFLYDLQSAHDSAAASEALNVKPFVSAFKERMVGVAAAHRLDASILQSVNQ